MRRLLHSAGLALVISALPAPAQTPVVTQNLPGAELRGAASFRFLGLNIYDARFFTPGGAALDWSQDMALELTYARSISGPELVEQTLGEMGRIGSALPIGAALGRCFSDVGRGDRYLAISDGPNRVIFWRNGAQSCRLEHPDIRRRFMEIFLGSNTRSAAFTRRLRGQ